MNRDPLTGLRAGGPARDRRPAAAIWIDIDHLKAFNDREGYAAGDAQIALVAGVIRDIGGDGSTYRAGGDEFLVAVPGGTVDDAAHIAERIREAVESAARLTVSAGVAAGADLDDAWARAKSRTAVAKVGGRNAVAVDR